MNVIVLGNNCIQVEDVNHITVYHPTYPINTLPVEIQDQASELWTQEVIDNYVQSIIDLAELNNLNE